MEFQAFYDKIARANYVPLIATSSKREFQACAILGAPDSFEYAARVRLFRQFSHEFFGNENVIQVRRYEEHEIQHTICNGAENLIIIYSTHGDEGEDDHSDLANIFSFPEVLSFLQKLEGSWKNKFVCCVQSFGQHLTDYLIDHDLDIHGWNIIDGIDTKAHFTYQELEGGYLHLDHDKLRRDLVTICNIAESKNGQCVI